MIVFTKSEWILKGVEKSLKSKCSTLQYKKQVIPNT